MFVAVAPDKVVIEGPTEAKAGDALAFKCVTGNSNPAAAVQWLVDGNQVDANFTHSVRHRQKGTSINDVRTFMGEGV